MRKILFIVLFISGCNEIEVNPSEKLSKKVPIPDKEIVSDTVRVRCGV